MAEFEGHASQGDFFIRAKWWLQVAHSLLRVT